MRDPSAYERFGVWVNHIPYDEEFYEKFYPDLSDDERWGIHIESVAEDSRDDVIRMMKEVDRFNRGLEFYRMEIDGDYGSGFFVSFVEEPRRTDPESLCRLVYGEGEEPTRSRIARAARMHEDECERIAAFLSRSARYGFYPSDGENSAGDNGMADPLSRNRRPTRAPANGKAAAKKAATKQRRDYEVRRNGRLLGSFSSRTKALSFARRAGAKR